MKSPIRLVDVAHDFPFPPTHGGKVDIWNRIQAMKREQVSIFLISWSDQIITSEERKIILQHVDEFMVFPRRTTPFVAADPFHPSFVTARSLWPWQNQKVISKLEAFKPNIVLLDGIAGATCARHIVKHFKVPLVYRSNNVEHEYARELYKSEKKLLRKIARYFNIHKTMVLEKSIRYHSDLIVEAAEGDKAYWANWSDMKEPKVLNPFFMGDNVITDKLSSKHTDIDILFVGNLSTPNNIFGLEWFINNVSVNLNDLTIVMAGANPNKEFCRLCEQHRIQVIANPEEVKPLYERAKVLINPIWHGSGINVKMIEMLYTGKPIISTSLGTRGLCAEVIRYISVADDALSFNEAIRNRLIEGCSLSQRDCANKHYSWENVRSLIAEMYKFIH